MQFSVVIPTHNRMDSLRLCLEAVLAQRLSPHEIIVVDDASTDGTAVTIPHQFPQITFIHLSQNQGPAVARNRGIQAATGDVIAFTDDDCRPPDNWLEKLAAGFNKYPHAGAVGGVQLPPEDMQDKHFLARYEAFVTRHVYQVGETDVIGTPAPGGTNNLAIPVRVLDEIGGFDSRFPAAAGEDADLLQRIAAAGYETVCLPVPVFHYPQYSLISFCRQQLRRGIGASFFNHKYGRQRPLLYELARLILSPLIYFLYLWRYHRPASAFVHTIAGLLQTLGRIQGRKSLAAAPKYAWQSSASPTKLAYLQQYSLGHTALDIGSGASFYSGWLTQHGFAVTAVDRFPPAQPNRNIIQADLCALPFQQPFDTVLCFDVLEHVANERAALAELRRLTGKRLLLSVPNKNDELLRRYNLTFKHHVDKTHYREYQPAELKTKLMKNGFRIVHSALEGPINPAIFAEFIRPRQIRPIFRFVIKALFQLGIIQNNTLKADVHIVAEPVPITLNS